MANLRIIRLRGVTTKDVAALKAQSVTNADHLLSRGRTPKGRRELAAATGLSEAAILELVNRADLARVKGVGRQFSNLLENAGVDTVRELAQRKPEHLHATLVEHAVASEVKRAPSLKEVESWVTQAKSLPRMVEY